MSSCRATNANGQKTETEIKGELTAEAEAWLALPFVCRGCS